MEPRIISKFDHDGEALVLYRGQYRNGDRTAIWLTEGPDGPIYAHVSVNVLEAKVAETEFVLHHDLDSLPRLVDKLLPYFADTGRTVGYGFVTDRPVWSVRPAFWDRL